MGYEVFMCNNNYHVGSYGDLVDLFDYYTKNDSSKEYNGPYDLTIKVNQKDLPNGLDTYKARDGGELAEECLDPEITADGEDTTDDELLKYTQEEEYEVFDLRIIHRKNRFA